MVVLQSILVVVVEDLELFYNQFSGSYGNNLPELERSIGISAVGPSYIVALFEKDKWETIDEPANYSVRQVPKKSSEHHDILEWKGVYYQMTFIRGFVEAFVKSKTVRIGRIRMEGEEGVNILLAFDLGKRYFVISQMKEGAFDEEDNGSYRYKFYKGEEVFKEIKSSGFMLL